jgi:hypothetical protein
VSNQTAQLVLPNQQFWVLLVGAAVPVLTYWFNKVMPWQTEQTKAIVHVIVLAVAGVAYTAIFGDVHGTGDFLQQVITAVISGLFAHNILWKPTGLNLVFGANSHDQQTHWASATP